MLLQFDAHDLRVAKEEWGCNCGPASIAFVLCMELAQVRPHVEAAGFSKRKPWMNPTQVGEAIELAGGRIRFRSKLHSVLPRLDRFMPSWGIVRIQWRGPWTKPGVNPLEAYRYTHWIGSLKDRQGRLWIFDVNHGDDGLLARWDVWRQQTAPRIMRTIVNADGTWHASHLWEIQRPKGEFWAGERLPSTS